MKQFFFSVILITATVAIFSNNNALALSDKEYSELIKASPEFKKADMLLATYWKKLRNWTSGNETKAFIAEQVKWLKNDRDKDASDFMNAGFSKGEAYARATVTRIRILKVYEYNSSLAEDSYSSAKDDTFYLDENDDPSTVDKTISIKSILDKEEEYITKVSNRRPSIDERKHVGEPEKYDEREPVENPGYHGKSTTDNGPYSDKIAFLKINEGTIEAVRASRFEGKNFLELSLKSGVTRRVDVIPHLPEPKNYMSVKSSTHYWYALGRDNVILIIRYIDATGFPLKKIFNLYQGEQGTITLSFKDNLLTEIEF
jgi:hypothetical protein